MSRMGNRDKTVAMGLSGGVDSAVAAWRLRQDGWRVVGLTMSIWDGSVAIPDKGLAGCFGPGEARDLEAAAAVARRLGIEHRVVRLAAEYRQTVLDYFREEYLAGRTPNPCVRCNQRVKFGFLPEAARAAGVEFDRFATGHYARLAQNDATGRWELRRGADRSKDQSYFLSRLTQGQLAGVEFPLGGLTKAEVRQLAREQGWDDLADREESQDFIECKDYSVLFRAGDGRPGDFVTLDGKVLGRHQGIHRYTIGQRKGLGLGGGGTPWHVLAIDAERNLVVVGSKEDLHTRHLAAGDVNWVGLAGEPGGEFRCEVQIRQQHRGAGAVVRPGEGKLTVEFDEPQLAVTPGQIAVFYDGDTVLASGVIETGG